MWARFYLEIVYQVWFCCGCEVHKRSPCEWKTLIRVWGTKPLPQSQEASRRQTMTPGCKFHILFIGHSRELCSFPELTKDHRSLFWTVPSTGKTAAFRCQVVAAAAGLNHLVCSAVVTSLFHPYEMNETSKFYSKYFPSLPPRRDHFLFTWNIKF